MSETHSDLDSLLPLTHLSFLILLALADGQQHGYAVIKAVERLSEGRLRIRTGTFYSALKRMLQEGLLKEAPAPSRPQTDSRRRYYAITPLGLRATAAEAKRLEKLVTSAQAMRILAKEESQLSGQ